MDAARTGYVITAAICQMVNDNCKLEWDKLNILPHRSVSFSIVVLSFHFDREYFPLCSPVVLSYHSLYVVFHSRMFSESLVCHLAIIVDM